MQLADTLLEGLANGIVSRQAFAECLDNFARVYATAELEAQHRKTWALALIEANKHIGGLWADLVDIDLVNTGASDYFGKWRERIRALPCPPIEATKDK